MITTFRPALAVPQMVRDHVLLGRRHAGSMSDPAGTEWFDRPGGEPVELREPSPRWLKLAEEWSDAIGRALFPLRPRIEHVGSTAIPGLLARPVIDLQVSVPDVAEESTYRPGSSPSASCCGPESRDTASSARRRARPGRARPCVRPGLKLGARASPVP